MEAWVQVSGFEGIYDVSDKGNVRCLLNNRGTLLSVPKLRSITTDKKGYSCITLSKNRKKYTFFIHRLVAIGFICNELGLPEVNHIDEDPSNNDVSNLEWCTSQYNMEYSHSVSFTLINPEGIIVSGFNLRNFCKDNNLDSGNISRVLSGKQPHHKGWTK